MTGVGKNDPIMKDEIFGALLPIMVVDSSADAIEYINEHDHPLAMYVFSTNSKLQKHMFDHTNSGIAIGNDLYMNMLADTLPFGGVGESGCGAYHGKHGFDTYTHKRATMIRPAGMEIMNEVRYPPITASKLKLISFFGWTIKFWLREYETWASSQILCSPLRFGMKWVDKQLIDQ